jgi:hypothetical protein
MFPRYGYPNDLLIRLSQQEMRVVDVPVRPVYGPQWRSGIRITRVVGPLLRLLSRAIAQRILRRTWQRLVPRADRANGSNAEMSPAPVPRS